MQLLHSSGSPMNPQESPHFLYFGCDPYLPHLAAFLQPKLRYLGSDKGMTHLDKLRQAYMLAALNTKEACSKQNIDKYDDIPQYKIGDLIMIKTFDKNQIGTQNTYLFQNCKIDRYKTTRSL